MKLALRLKEEKIGEKQDEHNASFLIKHNQQSNRQIHQLNPSKQKQHKKISYFKKELNSVKALKKVENDLRETQNKNRFTKLSSMLNNIMTKHKQMKTKIEHLRKQKENKQNQCMIECTFQPKLTTNPRYRINSRLDQRNKSWDQIRVNHFISIKQEIVKNQVRECSFTPKLVSKPKSQKYLKDKQYRTQKFRDRDNQETSMEVQNKTVKTPKNNLTFTPQKVKQQINFASIRSMIKNQMSRIPFNF